MWFVYSKFKRKKWLKLSESKRFEVFVALEKKVAKELGIEPLRLELVYNDKWNCFGAFTVNGNAQKILLNALLLDNPALRFHAMETISHETRHAYQYSVVKRGPKWYEFTAKKWERNWRGYFNAATDNVMYNNQSVERDAQKYSLKFLKRHHYDDTDYKNTLDAIAYRYDRADDEARRKYGIFYKHKIEKNIKNNSR